MRIYIEIHSSIVHDRVYATATEAQSGVVIYTSENFGTNEKDLREETLLKLRDRYPNDTIVY